MNFMKLWKSSRKSNICVMNFYYRNSLFSSFSKIIEKSDTKHPLQHDDLAQNIRRATDALNLFDTISGRGKDMNSDHVVLSLRSLYNLQKNGHTTLHSSQILKHPEFELLCQSLKFNIRAMEVSNLIESLKFLSFLGVSSNSEITVILLNLIRQQINELELNQIVFLDFLLKKFATTPLIEALKLALPMLFQINLSVKLDHENVPQLTEFLGFVSKNKVSDKCITQIITSLTLHADNLSAENAMSIIWSLSDIRRWQVSYDKLIRNSMNAFRNNMENISFVNIEITLTKVIDKYIHKHPEFYCEDFLNKCAEIVIKNDIGFLKGTYVLKKFNKISFVNINLLNYLAQKICRNPEMLTEGKPTVLFTFVTAFSTANYRCETTQQWEIITNAILNNKLLLIDRNELPWMRFCLELMSLNCYNENLYEKIFSDEFLYKHLAREYNLLDYLQLLSLNQSVTLLKPDYTGKLPDQNFIDKAIEINFERVDFPLQRTLEFVYGEMFIKTNVKTKYGHVIDHVMKFSEGKPVPFINTSSENYLEEIQKSTNNLLIGIIALPKSYYALNTQSVKGIFELRLRTLEVIGIKITAINIQKWTELRDEEKIPFLMQTINQNIV